MVDFTAGTESIGEYWMNLEGETDDMFPSDGFGGITDDNSDNHLSDAIETVVTRVVFTDNGGAQATFTIQDGDGNLLYRTQVQQDSGFQPIPVSEDMNLHIPRTAAGFAIFSGRCSAIGLHGRIHYHVLRRKPQTSPRSDVY